MANEKLKITINANDIEASEIDLDLDFEPVDDVDFFEQDSSKKKEEKKRKSRKRKRAEDGRSERSADSDGEVTFRVTLDENKTQQQLFRNRVAVENEKVKAVSLDMTTDDVTRPETQQRRLARAKRFGIDHKTIDFTVSEEELTELYSSMEVSRKNQHWRLEAIYVRGVDEMNTFDVQRIFGEYYPDKIEWINDGNCCVVWKDSMISARAMLDLTKPLKRVKPVKDAAEEGEVDRSSDEEEGQLKQTDDDLVEVKQQPSHQEIEDKKEKLGAQRKDDFVEVDVTKIAVPSGKWRVLTKHVDNNTLLIVRFSTVVDVKVNNAHKYSNYYKEHGNPHFDGLRGLISGSRRRLIAKRQRTEEPSVGVYSYKWTNREKVRPGLNLFKDNGDELEWDYEHDTRFYESDSEKVDPSKQDLDTASSTKNPDIPSVKSRGRGVKKLKSFKSIGADDTMRADQELKKKKAKATERGMQMDAFDEKGFRRNDEDDDDLLVDYSDDRNPSPTAQPWDRPAQSKRMKVTVLNESNQLKTTTSSSSHPKLRQMSDTDEDMSDTECDLIA